MRFRSTARRAPAVPFSEAIFDGLAPDGGLYVPESFPEIDPERLDAEQPFPAFAAHVLKPFLADDRLSGQIESICCAAFDFPLPLRQVDERTAFLELFHGPTAAFKDFGARFLAECMSRVLTLRAGESVDSRTVTILVATSGDTGGAVASAFHRKPGVRVAVLYPAGGVSPLQERQLTCWGDNVRAFAVRGVFDDCQRMVKAAFADDDWRRRDRLSSANSISIGRLLPQAAYFAAASALYRSRTGRDVGLVVPTGNMGNVVGAFWARRLGFPIRRIAMATNANRTIVDWFEDGAWRPRPSVATLANAMDVGDPSNMERLFDLHEERSELLRIARAASFDDEAIRRVIGSGPESWGGQLWCPHTATAVGLRRTIAEGDWIVIATAHPAKFRETVEPAIGRAVPLPPELARLTERASHAEEIDADPLELKRRLG